MLKPHSISSPECLRFGAERTYPFSYTGISCGWTQFKIVLDREGGGIGITSPCTSNTGILFF